MVTRRTISNISYNSRERLDFALNELKNNGVIDYYAYIFHKAEKGEKKDHFHFVISPSKQIDTSKIRNLFIEQNDGILDCKITSKWEYTTSMCDWVLYAVHNPQYLAKKKKVKQYQYEYEDITFDSAINFDFFVEQAITYLEENCVDLYESMIPYIEHCCQFSQWWENVGRHYEPITHIQSWKICYDLKCREKMSYRAMQDEVLEEAEIDFEVVTEDVPY